MVCDRCIKVVHSTLHSLGVSIEQITLGEAVITVPDKVDHETIREALNQEGFELLDDGKTQLVNQIRNYIIKHIHHSDKQSPQQLNFSELLEQKIGRDYSYLSNLFSSIEGRTIEKYIIQQRIEKVKELLKYGDKTISEIAFELNYSSAQYLSNQFKQVTGMTPSHFRELTSEKRTPLDQV